MQRIDFSRGAARRSILVFTACAAIAAVCLLIAVRPPRLASLPDDAASTTASATLSSSASPPPGASETLTTTVPHAVTLHSGQVATVHYRADDTGSATVTVDLVVTKNDGTVRRRLVSDRKVTTGVDQVWRGRLRLPRGRYLLVAHATDPDGLTQASTHAARLRVLAPLPPLVPTVRARRAAFAWAAQRAGDVAVAVVDSRGRAYGYHAHRPFVTASTVKALLLVAYLRRHPTVSATMRSTLTRMITESDNAAADAVYASVGRAGLVRLARQAGMSSFRASSAWIVCRVDAADMARFFRDMERYIPRAHRRFANQLLSHVVSWQSWGIPAVARPLGYRVYFKPGWLGAWTLASQASRLEKGRVRLGIAVFTNGNAPGCYGKETVAGVTARLLRR